MKTNDRRALPEKSISELEALGQELWRDIVTGRLEKQHSKNKNVHLNSLKRKDLARVLSVLGEKKLKEKAV